MSTRGEIRDIIKEYSQRKNIPDATMNGFIELALSKANRMLRIPPLERLTQVDVSGQGYFRIPEDFLEMKELSLDLNEHRIILERKSIQEVDFMFTHAGGNPKIFGRLSSLFRIAPWDLGDSTALMYYFNIIPKMVDDGQNNWITNFAPELLIYGGLAELSKYTRDDEGVQRWNSQFTEAVNIIQGVEDRAEWRGSTIGVTIQGSY